MYFISFFVVLYFFFFKQKTAYEMRISDWSSDVCSSDLGIQVVQNQELPLSTLSFDSPARSLANSGADYALIVLETTQAASFAQSLNDIGYELKFEEYLIVYGTPFIEMAGPAAEGATNWIRSLPNEEPGTNPDRKSTRLTSSH